MKTYFKNLNALRFFAASLVIIHHTEQLKKLNGLANAYDSSILKHFGKLGVCLFFVLSGFLITSLLLTEKAKYKQVDIGSFYMRRVLRIWPLYFLIVLLSLFIMPMFPALQIPVWANPRDNLFLNGLLMALILPNLQAFFVGQLPYSAQCWSIGVEEQFYLFWPLVVQKSSSKRALKAITIKFIVGYVLLRIIMIQLFKLTHLDIFNTIDSFLFERFQIECILIGSLFALINRSSQRRLFTSKLLQHVCYISVFVCVSKGFFFMSFYWEVYSLLFGIIILNLVNSTSILNLENRVFNHLGKISYGLYMWHYFVINAIIRLASQNSLVIYIGSFIGTIAAAHISYKYFERIFLEIKNRYDAFQNVRSWRIATAPVPIRA